MGELTAVTCGSCGAVMPAGLLVCGECGEPMSTQLPTQAATVDDPQPLPVVEIDRTSQGLEEASQLEETAALGEADTSAPVVVEDVADGVVPVSPGEDEPAAWFTPAPDDVHPRAAAPVDKDAPSAPAAAPAARRPTLLPRRRVLMGAGIVVVAACAIGAAAAITGATASSPAAAGGRPVSTAAPTTASTVTWPGFSTVPSWSASKVDAAATAGARLIGVSGSVAHVWDVATGEDLQEQKITGDNVRVITAGPDVDVQAVAVVSDSEAWVWFSTTDAPVRVDLSGGRRVEARSGALIVTGPDTSFVTITAAGETALVPPRPGMVVLGVDGDSAIWAGSGARVIRSSPNGTALSDIRLAPPAPGATITPRTGWVRAATADTVVVGWTLTDGSTVTGVHATATGDLQASFPGSGEGPGRSRSGVAWVSDGQLVDLSTGRVSPLPDGFTASRFVGETLYGALATGTDASLFPGTTEPEPMPAATVRPLTITADVLVTLTAGDLSVYPAKKK